ncbi:30S ribosomal protein S12 methylthiotransferase RimO [Gemmatimonadota bacterium]
MNPTVAFVTLGCAKNSVDSEKAMGALAADGFSLTTDPTAAEVVIINTCGFIEAAREESIDEILQIAELKESGRLRWLVVGGCLAARYRDDLEAELPEVDRFLGLLDPQEVRAAGREATTRLGFGNADPGSESTALDRDIPALPEGIPDIPRILTTPAHFAYLKIAEGCGNACSFCAIPLIRGGTVSVPPDELVSEAAALAGSGVKELIVIAQDTTLYGYDLRGGSDSVGEGGGDGGDGGDVAALLQRLEREVEGLTWLRLMYAYPTRVTDALIEVMSASSTIVPYLDLPVQSGSDNILKAMRRGMGRTAMTDLIHSIRERVAGITLRTSIITGFPGEGEREHRETLDLIREIRFERLGVFTYSPEEGTRAFDLTDTVPEEEKERRAAEILEVQRGIMREINDALVGEVVDVMLDESLEDLAPFSWLGRTSGDAPEVDQGVYLELPESDGPEAEYHPGEIVRAEIVGTIDFDLEGVIVG